MEKLLEYKDYEGLIKEVELLCQKYNLSSSFINSLKKEEILEQIKNNDAKICEIAFSLVRNEIIAKLDKADKCVEFIDDYLNKSDKSLTKKQTAMSKMLELINFFNEIDYIPSPDLCLELVRTNKKINNILETLVKENMTVVENGMIDSICDDITFVTLVENYCDYNNIDIDINDNDVKNYYDELRKLKRDRYIDDNLQLYCTDLQRPLLTRNQEKELFLRIARGDKKAKDIVIESNLRLVMRVAYKYKDKGLELLDLIQEGNMGLIKAVGKFDLSRGNKFSYYAVTWIRQGIVRAIQDKSRGIRIPAYKGEQITRLIRIKQELTLKLNRTPTIEELVKETGLKIDTVNELLSFNMDVSLNELIGEDDSALESVISSPQDTIEDTCLSNAFIEGFYKMLHNSHLTKKEIDVLTRRFGLGGVEEETLESIGNTYGVTKEAIRGTESRAIRKMINSNYIDNLVIYLDSTVELDVLRAKLNKKTKKSSFIYQAFSDLKQKNKIKRKQRSL